MCYSSTLNRRPYSYPLPLHIFIRAYNYMEAVSIGAIIIAGILATERALHYIFFRLHRSECVLGTVELNEVQKDAKEE